MSLRLLGLLQWFGLLGAAGAWAAQHLVGYGVTDASCSVAGIHWGVAQDAWQIGLMVGACIVIVAAEGAAAIVFRETRDVEETAGPPLGRLHFFATAALVANLLFLGIVVMDGLASVLDVACRQS
ncbi:MAG: hypothetical protein ABR569_00545 [Gaiellaceae bacterium]